MKRIKVAPELLAQKNKLFHGAFTILASNQPLAGILEEIYGRPGLSLKVFKQPAKPLDEFLWGKMPLVECTKIQNIFAMHSFAPRVYDIILVNGKIAQVTELALPGGEFDKDQFHKARREHSIRVSWDVNDKNLVGSMLVDFQAFWFPRPEDYVNDLVERAYKYAAWGSRSEPYQSVLGMASQRDFDHRVKMMRLAEVDFIGKTVLDLGCNLGNFSRYAHDRGAKLVVGVDLPATAEVAYEIANWLDYWDIDFWKLRLPHQKDVISGKFDVVFALVMDQHIGGYAPWVAELCKDTFYLEGHVPQREETFRDKLERDFSGVEFLGMTRDHGPRPLFRCRKG